MTPGEAMIVRAIVVPHRIPRPNGRQRAALDFCDAAHNVVGELNEADQERLWEACHRRMREAFPEIYQAYEAPN